jgi:hypothetical protein
MDAKFAGFFFFFLKNALSLLLFLEFFERQQTTQLARSSPIASELFFADEERCGGLQPNRCES